MIDTADIFLDKIRRNEDNEDLVRFVADTIFSEGICSIFKVDDFLSSGGKFEPFKRNVNDKFNRKKSESKLLNELYKKMGGDDDSFFLKKS